MHIPFFNLQRENQPIIDELQKTALEVINSGHYILGAKLTTFENSFANYLNTKFCFGVGNGLEALVLLLRALDIKQGDEVIVPAHTFIATWLAVSQVGAQIVAVEPDDTYNISVEKISEQITAKTKAIIPVHLYGRPANMTAIMNIAKEHDIWVIEDAAQAQGSSHHGNKCGNLADAAAFSFYPAKNLGAFGDAGAITTNNKDIADKIRSLRNYGSVKKYQHHTKGVNSRLDEIQAAILTVKLKQLDHNNQLKQGIANQYYNQINNKMIQLPLTSDNNNFCAWHQFVLRVEDRQSFISHLDKKGISTLIHYPIPAHQSGAYRDEFKHNSFPITEQLSRTVVSIPLYASLTDDEINHIIRSVNDYQ